MAQPNDKSKGNGKDDATQGETPSALVIEFLAPGMAEFNMRTLGKVTPAQILSAAAWLQWYANRQFEFAAQRVEQVVARPGLVMPGNLRAPSKPS